MFFLWDSDDEVLAVPQAFSYFPPPLLLLLVFPELPIPLFALDLPRRLVAVADALLGMVNIELLLLLPLPLFPLNISCTPGSRGQFPRGLQTELVSDDGAAAAASE
jgi:hypothetical protein